MTTRTIPIAECLLAAIVLNGCAALEFRNPETISTRPFPEWTERDCITLLMAAVQHNYHGPEKPGIGVMVTPHIPTVVFALNRMSQGQHQWSDGAFRERTNILLREMLGVYVDWEHGATLYNSELRALNDTTMMDSLTFLVILTNNTWPCRAPYLMVADRPFMPLTNNADWPCSTPEISRVESCIRLVNGRGESVVPTFVWGRRNDLLTTDESLFVRFPLRRGSDPFVESGGILAFEITGLGEEKSFEFDSRLLR